ncbi:MAG: hypothetical protein AB1489_13665 [Acidobacteriota bacterium]
MLKRYVVIALFLSTLFFNTVAKAQVTSGTASATDRSTPSALAPGTNPIGSYGGSNFDSINLFNGNLNLTFPLASLGGRAGLGVSVVLSYNSKIWKVEQQINEIN